MYRISKHRIGDAAAKSILLYAVLHILILFVHGVRTGDFSVLNVFNILEVNLLFPLRLEEGLSGFLSVLVLIAVYVLVFTFFTRKETDTSRQL